jgi:hypothetical protein
MRLYGVKIMKVRAMENLTLGHLKGRPSHLSSLSVMHVSRCLSEELANVSVPVEQPASRVGTETGLVRVQRDRVSAARSKLTV